MSKQTGRAPLAVVKPAKPLGEMTDEELDRLADGLYGEMVRQLPTKKR